MKKVLNFILICLITCFSFYYTDKVIDFSKSKDPIMIEINKVKNEKEISVVNGILSKNEIYVGSSGYKINENESYEKMKKLDQFNESLIEYISVKPEIRKDKYYDKLIKGKNTAKKEISFIFRTNDISKMKQIIYILENNSIGATFFIDGKVLEKNISEIKQLFSKNSSIGYYSYDSNYDEINVRYYEGLINKNINNISKYCLYINDEFLKTCINHKINTISPTVIEKNLYKYIKNNKKEGLIYQIIVNELNIKELNSTIIYLKQKGYYILNIDELLKE